MGKVAGNPEFAKWWKRWMSRVQRMHIRRNLPARRPKFDRPQSRTAILISGASRDCEFSGTWIGSRTQQTYDHTQDMAIDGASRSRALQLRVPSDPLAPQALTCPQPLPPPLGARPRHLRKPGCPIARPRSQSNPARSDCQLNRVVHVKEYKVCKCSKHFRYPPQKQMRPGPATRAALLSRNVPALPSSARDGSHRTRAPKSAVRRCQLRLSPQASSSALPSCLGGGFRRRPQCPGAPAHWT